ncbi:MAG: peptidase M28 [Ignavibacteriales bacterium CG_4_9_14_3_um_filter_30_11]|nr:MAG: peptidase M28 [Ignavibacteriales bacterium CG_4_9_14_3_um_filter_30_11]
MKKKLAIILVLVTNLILLNAQTNFIKHNLEVELQPENSLITVKDNITIPNSLLKKGLSFLINQYFTVENLSAGAKLKIVQNSVKASGLGIDRENEEPYKELLLTNYEIIFPENYMDDLSLKIRYMGEIKSDIEQSKENYQRGFSQSTGIIDKKGVYLAGSTYWVPTFKDELTTFDLTVKSPKDWKTVSQGKRTENKEGENFHFDKWESDTPQEEIFLIAAKFTEYSYPVGAVTAMAFLRTPDDGLANKYLETTAQYLEMYRLLIGKYPYAKFALVENFWETGYGMPSFTLLGEKIIRFPFILHSSYPHELLHNWWGNSVYVDFKKGNWCEGLTAYMADHLIKEQRGQGAEYRMSTLQRFTDYVNESNDFPISKFISRHDGPSEAIGYGKTLMMFHMLRKKVGDEIFKKSFASFNRKYSFEIASFDNIRTSFEEVTNLDLKNFFKQWVTRKGAPEFNLANISQVEKNGKFNLSFSLNQIQIEDAFAMDIPIAFQTKDSLYIKIFTINNKQEQLNISFNSNVLKIIVDPQFDVFRRLDSQEIPSSFSKAYGAKNTLIVLPDTTIPNYPLYKSFVEQWIKGNENKFTIKNENEINELPKDNAVLLLSFKNKFSSLINNSIKIYNSGIEATTVNFEKNILQKTNNSFFISIKNPNNPSAVILLLDIGKEEVVTGLVTKLPHYGKYSYLAFEGEEPTNISKGQWQVVNSPLVSVLDETENIPELKFNSNKALAYLAPVFSADRMQQHVKYLASDKLKGRGFGTPELDSASQYISEKFKEYGLLPGGDYGSFYQSWQENVKGKNGKINFKNIIGVIPGTNNKLKDQAVVISAHYDHLGLGWPDVHKGNENKIHNGADDNASGVSVLLELAKILSGSIEPARTVIFVAFTGEEAGLLGSKYFVNNYKLFPPINIFANLNLDTVGRLFGNKLLILNGDTAREWKFIFMGIEYVTGVGIDMVTQPLDASDQVSFINVGIPSVQFFSGPNTDYHRPTDTFDKIDPDGMVKVATVVKEALEYLTERENPMPFTGVRKDGIVDTTKTVKEKTERRVNTGTIPDFAFSGKGVKVGGVSPDSPAEKAGLKKGDVIIKFNNKDVNNLSDYSNLLKLHKPGDVIEIEFLRAGKIINTKLTLGER